MEYRQLGTTDLMVSPICIGGWQLAGPLAFNGRPDGHPDPGKENVLRLIAELGERGVNCIDTAEQYGGGESERRVGQATWGQRDRWIISTKFGYRVGPHGEREDDSSPPTILASLEGSLKRLRTDRIDIYLYHCAPDVADLEAAREILAAAKKAGKIRYYGISTGNLDLMKALHAHQLLDVVQYPMSLLNRRPDIEAFVSEQIIGTQVRGIMAQGRLSGKYFHQAAHWRSDDNRFERLGGDEMQRYAAFEAILPEGVTMAQAAIRWTLDKPFNHTICMGAKNLADYESAIAAAEMPSLGGALTGQLEHCADKFS